MGGGVPCYVPSDMDSNYFRTYRRRRGENCAPCWKTLVFVLCHGPAVSYRTSSSFLLKISSFSFLFSPSSSSSCFPPFSFIFHPCYLLFFNFEIPVRELLLLLWQWHKIFITATSFFLALSIENTKKIKVCWSNFPHGAAANQKEKKTGLSGRRKV